jgi:hypothetical protein
MTILPDFWTGEIGIAAAAEANVKAKASAINLVIAFSPIGPRTKKVSSQHNLT